MPAGNPVLNELVREVIRRNGPVSFAWFMEQALYHPEFGYYSSGRCQIGRQGDYFTNASVGPLFGRLLAAQFAEMWETLGRPGDFMIVEQGAHHGDFARDALIAARERSPDFYAALRYRIVEPFSVLQERQRATVGDFSSKVSWERSLDDLVPFCGVHFSNELLDAMPVHLIARNEDNSEWRERMVGLSGDEFAFVDRPVVEERLRRQIEKLPPIPVSPYETEVNLEALDWVADVSRKLVRGFVLAVDYGYSREQFYAAQRSTGTLRSYSKHRTLPTPLQAIGESDITAHLDWTSIAERAEECGLILQGFTDQHHFIAGLLTKLEPSADERRGFQTLMHPEFLGTRFQYLALSKGAPGTGLSGFRFARDARKALEDASKIGP
jgi:SAM-dependent MidA family methyltransferase